MATSGFVRMTVASPLRLFLDANVLISAAWKENSRVVDLWNLHSVKLITSQYAVSECERNLLDETRRARLRRLITKVEIITSGNTFPARGVQLPEKDMPVLADALAAKSDYLITGDKRHFGQWYGKRLMGILVCPPGDLLELLSGQISHPRDGSL